MQRSRRRLHRHRLLTALILTSLLLSIIATSVSQAEETTPAPLDEAGSTTAVDPTAADSADSDSESVTTPLPPAGGDATGAAASVITPGPSNGNTPEPPSEETSPTPAVAATAPPAPSLEPTVAPPPTPASPTATAPMPENHDTVRIAASSGDDVLRPGATASYTIAYTVTTARAGTMLEVALHSVAGDLAGWRVRLASLDGQDDDWSGVGTTATQTETATAAPATFNVAIEVRVPDQLAAPTTVALTLSSQVVRLDGTSEPAIADQPPLSQIQAAPPPPTPAATPLVAAAGSPVAVADSPVAGDVAVVSPMSVGNENAPSILHCADPQVSYPNPDRIAPGQIITFGCTYKIQALATVFATVSGSLTLTATTGWTIAINLPGITAANVPITGTQTAFSPGPITFSSSQGVSIGVTQIDFQVLLRAPLTAVTSGQTVTIDIAAQCSGISVGNCVSSPTTKTSRLTAKIGMSGKSKGGGSLSGTIPGLPGFGPGDTLFDLDCGAPYGGKANYGGASSAYTIAPGDTRQIDCILKTPANAVLLNTLIRLGGTLNVAIGGTSDGWKLALRGQPASSSGTVAIDLGTMGNLSVLQAGKTYTFDVTAPASCSAIPANTGPLNALQATANYQVTLISNQTQVSLTAGYANVPLQLEGAASSAPAPPAVAATAVIFGSSVWMGTGYPALNQSTTVLVSLPVTTTCLVPSWQISLVASSLSRIGGGTAIPAAAVTFLGLGALAAGLTSLNLPVGTALDAPRSIVSGTAQTLDLTRPTASFPVNLRLTPPSSASAGTYTGILTVTSAAAP